MKRMRIALSCAALAVGITTGAIANDIYEWTDADGNVHYEDRPAGPNSERRSDITSHRTDNSVVQQRIQARVEAQKGRQEAKSVAAAAEREAEDNAAADAAERAKQCERARTRLETYVRSRRLYRKDENGERVYLDEKQQQHARQAAEEQVAKFCP